MIPQILMFGTGSSLVLALLSFILIVLCVHYFLFIFNEMSFPVKYQNIMSQN